MTRDASVFGSDDLVAIDQAVQQIGARLLFPQFRGREAAPGFAASSFRQNLPTPKKSLPAILLPTSPTVRTIFTRSQVKEYPVIDFRVTYLLEGCAMGKAKRHVGGQHGKRA